MSVGDIKGARRRQLDLIGKGLLPRPKKRTISEAIMHESRKAARMHKASSKKK
jgi:hypothetical protein